MALKTDWMRRTDWPETFAGAERNLLVRFTQYSRDVGRDLALAVEMAQE
jgi:hypothetical protein